MPKGVKVALVVLGCIAGFVGGVFAILAWKSKKELDDLFLDDEFEVEDLN